jgi:DNA replication protein DnaC
MSTARAEYSPGTSVRERWIRLSNVPLRFRSTHLDALDHPAALPRAQAWVTKVLLGEVVAAVDSPLIGKGLILQGEPGHGKTTLAAAVTMEVLRKANPQVLKTGPSMSQRPVYYTTYPELLRTQKQSWDGDETAQMIVDRAFGDAVDPFALLVLDDIGKEHQTGSGWAENVFDQIFRRRFDLGLPTIVTTNVPVKDWAEPYGEAMASFAHEAAYILDIMAKGGDRRR